MYLSAAHVICITEWNRKIELELFFRELEQTALTVVGFPVF